MSRQEITSGSTLHCRWWTILRPMLTLSGTWRRRQLAAGTCQTPLGRGNIQEGSAWMSHSAWAECATITRTLARELVKVTLAQITKNVMMISPAELCPFGLMGQLVSHEVRSVLCASQTTIAKRETSAGSCLVQVIKSVLKSTTLLITLHSSGIVSSSLKLPRKQSFSMVSTANQVMRGGSRPMWRSALMSLI
jgi:hypothetical protein